MKRFLTLCFALIFSASLLTVHASALDVPEIISESAVLMDAETGQVLYQKNSGKRMYPASTTKIMTGLLVAENCSPAEIARVSESAVDIDEWDSANIALQENEEMSVDSLMYAMMMPSANDAANVLAEHVAGSQTDFAVLMNERAKSIGAASTHFANAHGLHDPNHYTTAYDLALIAREAIQNETFERYFGTDKYTIPATNLNPYERPFTNYQYMLVNTTDYYNPDVIGGKVGYTYEAEHTMSTVAERNGRKLICTVMKSPNRGDKFADTKMLLEFGFNEFTQIYVEREKFPGFEEKIMQDGEEIGIAGFRSTEGFKALLHKSLASSAVKISYSEDGNGDAAYAEFRADTGNAAIPSLIGRARLERSIVMYVSDSLADEANVFISLMSAYPWIAPLAMFVAVLAIFMIFMVTGKIAASAREKRRQERLAERLEEMRAAGETRYRGPVPVVGEQFLIR